MEMVATSEKSKAFPRGGGTMPKMSKQQNDDDADDVSKSKSGHIDMKKNLKQAKKLTLQDLVPGTLVLCCVRCVRDDALVVELPDGLSGIIPAAAISRQYTTWSQRMDLSDDDIFLLPELYVPGQLLCCVVNTQKTERKRTRVYLSIDSKETNKHLSVASIQDGMILQAVVDSVEDSGYIMDVGVGNLKAFVSKGNATEYSNQYLDSRPLAVGQSLLCRVSGASSEELLSGDQRVLNLTLELAGSGDSAIACDGLKSGQLTPGMVISGLVEQSHKRGLVVKVGSLRVPIARKRLSRVVDDPLRYEAAQELPAVVLYVKPNIGKIGLSAQPHLLRTFVCSARTEFSDGLKVGEVTEFTVVEITGQDAVYFRMGKKGPFAFATKDRLHGANIREKYTPGSTHLCRIVGVSFFEHMLYVSTKKSVLRQAVVDVESAQAGTVLKAKVTEVTEKSVKVSVYNHINGIIPLVHSADVPPTGRGGLAKRFAIGDSVRCRVLHVDHNRQRLVLTAKPSLVSSELAPVVAYEARLAGTIADGCVVQIRDNGVLVLFYNGVKGLIGKKQLMAAGVQHPHATFNVGQVLRVSILKVDSDEQKMQVGLSHALDEVAANAAVHNSGSGTSDTDSLRLGDVFAAQVVSVQNSGLYVTTVPGGVSAFLPTCHITDSIAFCGEIASTYGPGTTIDSCTYFGGGTLLTVTAKPTLVATAAAGKFVRVFEEFEPGMMVCGCLARIHDQLGCFVELPGGFTGLASYSSLDLPNAAGLQVGQTVLARVQHVDLAKRRFALTLKRVACFDGNLAAACELLRQHLTEVQRLRVHFSKLDDSLQALAALQMGTVVDAQITQVTASELACKLDSGVNGLITRYHVANFETACVGEKMRAVVLWVDYAARCAELSTLDWLVKSASMTNKRDQSSAVQVGQRLKATCVAVKGDCFVLALHMHAEGRLAYMPARLFVSDALEYDKYPVLGKRFAVSVRQLFGQNGIIVQASDTEKQYGSVTDPESIVKCDISSTPGMALRKLQVGTICSSQVVRIEGLRMIVSLGGGASGILGKVHISEVTDALVNGHSPFERITVGQWLEVKVLTLPKPKAAAGDEASFAECTARRSKLLSKSNKRSAIAYQDVFKVGQRTWTFIDSLADAYVRTVVNPLWKGGINILHMSKDVEKLNDAAKTYLVGHAYNARILAVNAKQKFLTLSTLDPRECRIIVGEPTIGRIAAHGDVAPNGLITVRLPDACKGSLSVNEISDDFSDVPGRLNQLKDGQFVRCAVLGYRSGNAKRFDLSLRRSRLEANYPGKITDAAIASFADLVEGSVCRGFVKEVTAAGIFVRLGYAVTGRVKLSRVTEFFVKEPEKAFCVNTLVTVKVLSVSSGKAELSMLACDTGVPDQCPPSTRKRKRRLSQQSEEEADSYIDGGRQRRDSASSHLSGGTNSIVDSLESERSTRKVIPSLQEVVDRRTTEVNVRLIRSELHEQHQQENQGGHGLPVDQRIRFGMSRYSAENMMLVALQPEKALRELAKQARKRRGSSSESSESEAEEKQAVQQPRSKKSRVERDREEENALFKKEMAVLSNDGLVQSIEDYDRLVMTSPNSSLVWLRYMAYYLELADFDSARAVAERALKNISARDESERLNIWLAMLNLENQYGTKESFQAVVDRAVLANDDLKIYTHVVQILEKSQKTAEADEYVRTMLKKFRECADVWCMAGGYFLRTQRNVEAHKLLERALKSLPLSENVHLVSKFAQAEFQHGDKERGRTLFEGVVSNYPKRTDVWSVYIDMLTKYDCVEFVRPIFERVAALGLPAKKMKFFFKKWLTFEQKYGTPELETDVRRKAEEYVEQQQVALQSITQANSR